MLVPDGAGPRVGTCVVLGYDLPSVSGAAAAAAGRLAAALDSSLVVIACAVAGAPGEPRTDRSPTQLAASSKTRWPQQGRSSR